MRIVQVANFYGPRSGGIRTTMRHLALGYLAHGHDPVLVVPGERNDDECTPYGRVITLEAVTVPRSGGYRVITDVDRVCTVLHEVQPDRLEVSDRLTLRSLGWWARAHGVPAVMWAHERVDGVLDAFLPGPWPTRRIADAWNRSTAARFDQVVCSTRFAQQELDRIGWTRIAHVPLGVDLERFDPRHHDDAWRARQLADVPGRPDGLHDDVLLVLCSRLSPEKRPERALGALRVLGEKGVRARLLVLGDGPLRPALERDAADLPVRFLGYVADRDAVARTLASADVVLAPGPIETFGLAALEALASGTPVVASRSSAVGEILDAGSGLAVADDDESFADAVRELLAREPVARRAAARARAEQFPWSATVRAMLRVHGLGDDGPPTRTDAIALGA